MKTKPHLSLMFLAFFALLLSACEEILDEAFDEAFNFSGAKEVGPPLVFIPGISGSILMAEEDSHVLWPPGGAIVNDTREASIWESTAKKVVFVQSDFIRLSLHPDAASEDIFASDVIRNYNGDLYYGPFLDLLAAKGDYREYDFFDDPEGRTQFGCYRTQEPRPSLFVFAYDWRLANEDNAALLEDYVGCIAEYYPGSQINIVTHSMGGLIARRYIIDNPGKVNKLITVAAPFLGSPKPLFQMIYGKITDDFTPAELGAELLFSKEVKDMLSYYPGLHQLMASSGYYALGGPPYRQVDTLSQAAQNRALPETKQIDYAGLMGKGGVVDELFPLASYNGETPAETNRQFHSYSANGNNQDDWSNDTTGVKYYHMVGVQKSGDTPQSIIEAQGLTAAQVRDYTLEPLGQGDGTVPRLSAERKGAGLNFNAPDAELFVYLSGDDELLEHTGIMRNPTVMAKVLELLEQKDDDTPQEAGDVLKIDIHSVSGHIAAGGGQITGQMTNTSAKPIRIGNVRLELNDGSLAVPLNVYNILGRGQSTPFQADYSIGEGEPAKSVVGYTGEVKSTRDKSERASRSQVRISNVRISDGSSYGKVRATLTNESPSTLKVKAALVVWDHGSVASVRPKTPLFRNELAPGESLDATWEVRAGLPTDDVVVIPFATCVDC